VTNRSEAAGWLESYLGTLSPPTPTPRPPARVRSVAGELGRPPHSALHALSSKSEPPPWPLGPEVVCDGCALPQDWRSPPGRPGGCPKGSVSRATVSPLPIPSGTVGIRRDPGGVPPNDDQDAHCKFTAHRRLADLHTALGNPDAVLPPLPPSRSARGPIFIPRFLRS